MVAWLDRLTVGRQQTGGGAESRAPGWLLRQLLDGRPCLPGLGEGRRPPLDVWKLRKRPPMDDAEMGVFNGG